MVDLQDQIKKSIFLHKRAKKSKVNVIKIYFISLWFLIGLKTCFSESRVLRGYKIYSNHTFCTKSEIYQMKSSVLCFGHALCFIVFIRKKSTYWLLAHRKIIRLGRPEILRWARSRRFLQWKIAHKLDVISPNLLRKSKTLNWFLFYILIFRRNPCWKMRYESSRLKMPLIKSTERIIKKLLLRGYKNEWVAGSGEYYRKCARFWVGEKAADVCVWDVHFTARACVWMYGVFFLFFRRGSILCICPAPCFNGRIFASRSSRQVKCLLLQAIFYSVKRMNKQTLGAGAPVLRKYRQRAAFLLSDSPMDSSQIFLFCKHGDYGWISKTLRQIVHWFILVTSILWAQPFSLLQYFTNSLTNN